MTMLETVGEKCAEKVVKAITDARKVGLKQKPPVVTYGGELVIDLEDGRVLIAKFVEVVEEEVRKYADPKCKTCSYGSGVVRVRPARNINKIDVSNGKIPGNLSSFGDLQEFTCSCAQKRYLKKIPDVFKDPFSGWCKAEYWRIDTPERAVEKTV